MSPRRSIRRDLVSRRLSATKTAPTVPTAATQVATASIGCRSGGFHMLMGRILGWFPPSGGRAGCDRHGLATEDAEVHFVAEAVLPIPPHARDVNIFPLT